MLIEGSTSGVAVNMADGVDSSSRVEQEQFGGIERQLNAMVISFMARGVIKHGSSFRLSHCDRQLSQVCCCRGALARVSERRAVSVVAVQVGGCWKVLVVVVV